MPKVEMVDLDRELWRKLTSEGNYTREDLAKKLGIKSTTFFKWLSKGKLPRDKSIELQKIYQSASNDPNLDKPVNDYPYLEEDIPFELRKYTEQQLLRELERRNWIVSMRLRRK